MFWKRTNSTIYIHILLLVYGNEKISYERGLQSRKQLLSAHGKQWEVAPDENNIFLLCYNARTVWKSTTKEVSSRQRGKNPLRLTDRLFVLYTTPITTRGVAYQPAENVLTIPVYKGLRLIYCGHCWSVQALWFSRSHELLNYLNFQCID